MNKRDDIPADAAEALMDLRTALRECVTALRCRGLALNEALRADVALIASGRVLQGKAPFKREARYVVVKMNDIHASGLTPAQIHAFNVVCDQVAISRTQRGKPPLQAVVVEHDWPEYEPTWAAIEARMMKEI